MTWTLVDSESFEDLETFEWPAERAQREEAERLAAEPTKEERSAEYWANVRRNAMWPVDIINTALNVAGGMIQFPAQGIGMLSDVMGGASAEEAMELAARRGEGAEPIEMVSQVGEDVEAGVHYGMELPAKGARWVGGQMVDIGIPPHLATAITTPLEFALYALLFRGLKGRFPKNFDPAKISAKDLKDAELMIKNDAIRDGLVPKVREALKIEIARDEARTARNNIEAQQHWDRVRDLKTRLDKPDYRPTPKIIREPKEEVPGLSRAERMKRLREQEAAVDKLAEEAKAEFDYRPPREDRIPKEVLAEEEVRIKTPTGESPYVQKLNIGEKPKVKTPYTYEITEGGVVFTKRDGKSYKTKAAATHLKKSLAKEGVETEIIDFKGGKALREITERVGEEPIVERPAGELLPIETVKLTPEYYNDVLGDLAKLGDEWIRGDKTIDMLEVIEETRKITNSIDPRAWEGTAEVPEIGVATMRTKGEALQGVMRKRWHQEVAESDKSLVRWDRVGVKRPISNFSIHEDASGIYVLPKNRLLNIENLYKEDFFALAEKISETRYEITEVNVAKHLRRQGVGTKLYQELARVVEDRGGKLFLEKTAEGQTRDGRLTINELYKRGVIDKKTGRIVSTKRPTAEPLYADPNGKPFRSVTSAREWAAAKGLEGDVVENVDGAGWLIRKAPDEVAEPRGITEPPKWMSRFIEKEGEAIKTALSLKDESGALIIPEEMVRKVQDFKDRVRLTAIPDTASLIYKDIFQVGQDIRIAQHLNAFDSQALRHEITMMLPDIKERSAIPHVIENTRPMEVISREGRVYAVIMEEGFRRAKTDMIDAGLHYEFLEDRYVNHIIKDRSKAYSFMRHRKRVKKDEGWETVTIQELLDAGVDVVEDIAILYPTYMYNYRNLIINKKFADILLDMRGPEGYPLLVSRRAKPPTDSYVEFDTSRIREWAQFGRKQKISTKVDSELLKDLGIDYRPDVYQKIADAHMVPFRKGILRDLSKGVTYVHKDAYQVLNAIVPKPINIYEQMLGQFQHGVKRVIMYNPLIHGWNIESNVIMALGLDYFKGGKTLPERMLKMSLDTPEMSKKMRFMVEMGTQLQGIFDVSRRLGMDVYQPRLGGRGFTIEDMIADPRLALTHPLKGVKTLSDYILWDRIVKTGQIVIFDHAYKKFMKDGLREGKEAGMPAAMVANDLMGTPMDIWFTNAQKRILRQFLFARDWNVGLMRTLTGALGALDYVPGLGLKGTKRGLGARAMSSKLLPRPIRFEGMTDAQLKYMGKHYGQILVKGAIGIVVFANIMQAALLAINAPDEPYHPTWANEKGYRMDIDTGNVDAAGKRVYLKGWLYRQIDDYAKVISGHWARHLRSKASPTLRTIVELILNVDYMNRPIRKPGQPVIGQVGEVAKYIVSGLTSIDAFIGREDEVREWSDILWALSGTFVRRGLAVRGPAVLANLMRDVYEYNREKTYISRKAKVKLSKMIQRGKMEDATEFATHCYDKGLLSAEQIGNVAERLGSPFMFRAFTSGGRIKTEVMEAIISMPEKDQEKYKAAIRKFLGEAQREEPTARLPMPHGKAKSAYGNWSIVEGDKSP